MTINIAGNIYGSTGYSIHTRQLLNALVKAGADVTYDGFRPMGGETILNDDELLVYKKPIVNTDACLCIALPDQWIQFFADPYKKIIAYCVWEGTNIPAFYIPLMLNKRINNILVPSTHTRSAIMNSCSEAEWGAIREKVILCPHGVDMTVFKPLENRKAPEVFRFVANKGWARGVVDRGGLQYAIKAFNEEFNKSDPVEFVVKINAVYNQQGWNLTNELNALQLRPDGGRIAITTDEIPYNKLADFYNCGDVFLAPNMGESFGLPIAEAMACGLPCITTNFGGQTDFVNDANGWLVDYDLVEVTWDFMYEGVRWARPNMEHLKRLMRQAYNDKEDTRRKGLQALQDIQAYTWDKAARTILSLV